MSFHLISVFAGGQELHPEKQKKKTIAIKYGNTPPERPDNIFGLRAHKHDYEEKLNSAALFYIELYRENIFGLGAGLVMLGVLTTL